ncbi:MAG TPA: trimethylamine methyltransferase family protein [Alphaproteobacteria bacterium]|nr:trimethylamine methyltransferase family protein [Alphaproteobacteria bacterium]
MVRLSQRRAQRRDGGGTLQRPFRLLRSPYPPVELLSEDQIEAIHQASLRILEEMGLQFLDDEALDLLRRQGAMIDPETRMVRMERALVLDAIAKAPAEIALEARNSTRNLAMGGNAICFSSVAGPPNCSDLDRGRRPGTLADLQELLKLAQSLNAIHLLAGAPVAAIDQPAATRHLDVYRSYALLTDRVWQGSALGRERIADAIAINALSRGLTLEDMSSRPGLLAVVNSNSPRRVDGPMLQGLMEMARHGQPVVVTPFTLAGAMSPVSLAGALALQNAEAIGLIAFMQMVRPGAPAVYGGFTSNVDMRTGAPAFGTPEYVKAVLAGGQLARRYRLPYRSSNVNSATVVDAQAAYESVMSLWAAVLAHTNLVYHGAGWLEGGLVASYEKMVLDAELLQEMAEFLQPLEVSEDTLALDAIREVGPGGHFFGAAHTLARYETAFYQPMLSDWRNFETWREAGARTATERANRIWKQLLAEYHPPPIDPAIAEAIDDYVARRRPELEKNPPP